MERQPQIPEFKIDPENFHLRRSKSESLIY